MSVYFTSDLHVSHKVVAELRVEFWPHLSSEQKTDIDFLTAWHDEALAQNWDRTVKKDDQVWVLGDISSGTNSAQHNALAWISQRPGVKHLITGNHDGPFPHHRDSHRWQPEYLKVFASVQPFARRRVLSHSVLLSHFPYERDRDEPRHMQYRLPDLGEWLLHGHLHCREKQAGREIHVGLDAWDLKLVPLSEIEKIITRPPCPHCGHPAHEHSGGPAEWAPQGNVCIHPTGFGDACLCGKLPV